MKEYCSEALEYNTKDKNLKSSLSRKIGPQCKWFLIRKMETKRYIFKCWEENCSSNLGYLSTLYNKCKINLFANKQMRAFSTDTLLLKHLLKQGLANSLMGQLAKVSSLQAIQSVASTQLCWSRAKAAEGSVHMSGCGHVPITLYLPEQVGPPGL